MRQPRPGPIANDAAAEGGVDAQGADVTVSERAGVANGASGKSGGFLAMDWCRGTPVDPLARRSFALLPFLRATDGGRGECERQVAARLCPRAYVHN